ncbi:MAG: G5 domain-containing protein [Acidimicrobiales bacterium]
MGGVRGGLLVLCVVTAVGLAACEPDPTGPTQVSSEGVKGVAASITTTTSTTTSTTTTTTTTTTPTTTTTVPPTTRASTPVTRVVTATTAVPASGSGCHPSYSGACVPAGVSDVDCGGGSGNGPYYVYEVNFRVVGPDVYDLDRNGDGIACES